MSVKLPEGSGEEGGAAELVGTTPVIGAVVVADTDEVPVFTKEVY